LKVSAGSAIEALARFDIGGEAGEIRLSAVSPVMRFMFLSGLPDANHLLSQ
jgi:hypothetical protein